MRKNPTAIELKTEQHITKLLKPSVKKLHGQKTLIDHFVTLFLEDFYKLLNNFYEDHFATKSEREISHIYLTKVYDKEKFQELKKKFFDSVGTSFLEQSILQFIGSTPAEEEKEKFISPNNQDFVALQKATEELFEEYVLNRLEIESNRHLLNERPLSSSLITRIPYSVYLIHHYHQDPIRNSEAWKRKFLKTVTQDEEAKLLGLELECCFRYFGKKLSTAKIPIPSIAAFEKDRSIAPQHEKELPIELVFPPLEYNDLLDTLQEWMRHISNEHWNVFGGDQRRCGIHITTTLLKETKELILAVLQECLESYPELYFEWSGRTPESIEWADPNENETSHYAAIHRRWMVNENIGVYEFRMFQTPEICTYSALKATLEKFQSLIQFGQQITREDLPHLEYSNYTGLFS